MGPEYESELSHVNTLRELNRKIPLFMRVKWTERAGTIIESGSRPNFEDFLKFVKRRARLVNNEFAEDLSVNTSKIRGKGQGVGGRFEQKSSTLTAGAQQTQDVNRESSSARQKCLFCSGVHRIFILLFYFLKNLFGSMYIYITHLKARSKTARYERDSLKSSHARHLPASNYMIICTVIYLYTHSIHIRTLTDKAHRDGLHTQTGYTQTLKGHFPSQSPRTRDFIM